MKKLIKIVLLWVLFTPFLEALPIDNEKKDNWIDYNGHQILYKQDYKMFLYPVLYNLPENKLYIKNIYSSMIFDQIRLTQNITIPDPFPAEIRYKNDPAMEDPRPSFLENYKASPRVFKLQVLPAARFPAQITAPENIVKDMETANLLKREDIHAISFITARGSNFLFKLYLVRNGSVFYQNELVSSETELSNNLFVFFQNVSVFLTRSETGTIEISASEEKSSVYINDQFAGYAPVTIPNVIKGENTIIVRKYGFVPWEKKVEVASGDKLRVFAELPHLKSVSSIVVKSNIEECDVYLGVDYKGQTPVEIPNVIPGKQRVHVVKKGYVDFFKTIEITKNQQTYNVTAEMKKGDSVKFYSPGQPVFLGLDYNKLFKASGIVTLGTGLVGVLFLVAKEEALNTISSYESYSSSALTDFPQYFDTLNSNATAFDGLSTGFFIASAVFFVSTIYFYIRFIGDQDVPIALGPAPGQKPNVQLDLNLGLETFHFEVKTLF